MKRKYKHNQNIQVCDSLLDEAFNGRLLYIHRSESTSMEQGNNANHSYDKILCKEPIIKCNVVLSWTDCSRVNNSTSLQLREANTNNQLNYVFNKLPVTNELALLNKKKYRTESILRWKTKRRKIKIQTVSKQINPMFIANDSSELAESSNRSSFTLNETTGL